MSDGRDPDDDGIDNGRRADPRTARRLLALAAPHRTAFALLGLVALVVAASEMALPWLTKHAIDDGLTPPVAAVQVELRSGDERLLRTLGGARAPLPADDRDAFSRGATVLSDRMLVPISALDDSQRRRLAAAGRLSPPRWHALPDDADVTGATVIVADDGRRFIAHDQLGTLPDATRATVLAPRRDAVAQAALAAGFLLLLRFAAGWLMGWWLPQLGARIVAMLRDRVTAHLLTRPLAALEREPVGRLVSRIGGDVAAVSELYTGVLVPLAKDVVLVLGLAVAMALLDWRLALATAALLPVLAWLSWTFRRRTRDAFRDLRRAAAAVSGFLQEHLGGMATVQLARCQERAAADQSMVNDREFRAGWRVMLLNAVFMPLVALVGGVAVALALWQGGHGVLGGLTSLGALAAFIAYVELIFAPLRDLAEKWHVLQGALAAGDRVFAVLDAPAEDAGGTAVPPRGGRIVFEDVWFHYGDAPGAGAPDWVMHGISFTLEPGQRLALVGPTGGGKSTLVALALRLYDPQRGRVLLDGVDLRSLPRSEVRRRLMPVLQEAERLPADLPAADGAAALTAIGLDAAAASDLAVRAGGALSSGERQLVALARAAAAAPDVLLLDEATASIDARTEAQVQAALTRVLSGRSALIVAHRLGTVRDADAILVLEHGRIVEQGPHARLLDLDGRYARLWRLGQATGALDAV